MFLGSHRRRIAALVGVGLLLSACGSTQRPRIARGPEPTPAEWAINDTLKIFYSAVIEVIRSRRATPDFYSMIDATTAGEVKAHILLAAEHLLDVGLEKLGNTTPQPPALLSAGLVAKDGDCVVARVVVDFTPTRTDRDKYVNPKLASFYALFRRLPDLPDPLKLNPTGWRWEQFIRQKVDIDSPTERILKHMRDESVEVAPAPPFNGCHATAGLEDDCDPPKPAPPFGVENDLGKEVVAFLACPPRDELRQQRDQNQSDIFNPRRPTSPAAAQP